MKSRLTMLLLMSAIMVATQASAQKGYWVVESNINRRNLSIVRVYDLNNQLIRETTLHRKIDIARFKDRRMLDRMLKLSFQDHEAAAARKAKRVTRGA